MTLGETGPPGSFGGTPRSKVHRPERRGVPRPRLSQHLAQLWDRRVAVVVAPAGSGKSTLLAQFAASAPVSVAWYQADTSDIEPRTLLTGLSDAVSHTLQRSVVPWASVEDGVRLLDSIEELAPNGLLLVIDDLHSIHATPAEADIERLIRYLPPKVHVMLGSRRMPALNLTRMRVADELVEVLADDLRFRAWEVEALFRDFYGAPLPPDEMARLARTTEGWAAGLQLFHLATRGRSPAERLRVLERLGTDSSLVREYLTQNVLHELDARVRGFLLDTCVLGRLSAPICDEFLGSTGSAAFLEELERVQLFTQSSDYGDYHYHEVLRSHLESMLLDQIGVTAMRARYLRAGEALEASGAVAEALRAYVCAEDAASAARILGRSGEELSGRVDSWSDLLPSPLLEHDPWVQLSHARRLVRDGRPTDAAAMYQKAAATFTTVEGREVCQREYATLAVWISPEPTPVDMTDWTALVRQATRADPARVRALCAGIGDTYAPLAEGLICALDGDALHGAMLLDLALAENAIGPMPRAIASIVRSLLNCLAGEHHLVPNSVNARPANEVPGRADADVQSRGAGWMGRLGRSASLLLGGGAENLAARSAVHEMERLSVEYGDGWGAATCALGLVLVDVCDGTASVECARTAERAALAYDALGAHVPALWARAARATLLARLGNTEAFRVAQNVVDDSSRLGPRWALAVASQVLAADPSTTASIAAAYGNHAGTLARELGVRLPSLGGAFSLPETPSRGVHHERSAPTRDSSAPDFGHRTTDRAESGTGGVWPDDERNREALANAPVGVRCLGGFELWIAGTRLDLDGLKPRFRALLRLLASRAGQPIHKGELAFSLWPDADEGAAARNVNVAISAIRQSIEPGSPRGASSIVGRDHEAYFFRAPEHTVIDHMELSVFARRAREASAAGDVRASITAFARSLTWYGGDLLPNDGSAEWVSKDRERLRLEAADVAQSLAELLLRTGDVSSAAHAAERGLQIDRFRDGLWRVLIDALDADDRRAEAERSRRRYADTLAELGLS